MKEKRKLILFEALELRAEYDSRIKTFKECFPETKRNRGSFFSREEEAVRRPSPGFDPMVIRKKIKDLETRRLKLNRAIQETNYRATCLFQGESLKLGEALEVRKKLSEQMGELHTQVVESAHERVIYKEGRDIIDRSDVSYEDASSLLDEARSQFRKLNRVLRLAAYENSVDFFDE